MLGLDYVTQLVLCGVAHLLLASALLFFRKSDDIRDVTRLWIGSQLVLSCAFILYLGLKTGLYFWFSTLPNAMVACGQTLMLIAIARFLSVSVRYFIVVGVIAICLQLSFRSLGWSDHHRLAAVLTVTATLQAHVVYLLAKQWSISTQLLRFLTCANAIVSLSYLARATESYFANEQGISFFGGWGQTVGLMGLYVNAMINGFGMILLLKERADAELLRLSTLDPLTETLNRRSFISYANDQIALARRHQHSISVLMGDIDHFKKINDQFGHHAGDTAICTLVADMRANLRASDAIGRWGGEEFVVLLPKTTVAGAKQLALRLMSKFAAEVMVFEGHEFSATISIGVAELLENEDVGGVIDRADHALYRAKNNGRNRVEVDE